MKRERLFYTGCILIVVSMLLAACGGGGGNSTSPNSIVSTINNKVGSPVVEDNTPIVSSAIIIDNNAGRPVVGDTLTGNYSFSDVNGNIDGTFTFRWLRHGIPINGAIESTYTLVVADSGQPIIFEVTLVAIAGTGSAVAASGITVVNNAPTISGVSISGNFVLGGNLISEYTYFDADNDLEGASIFRWLRNGVAINGGSGSIYTLTVADIGQLISFEVTPVAIDGVIMGDASVSSSIMIANSAPTASSVSITDGNGGGTFVGDILTGNYTYSDVDGDVQGTSIFRWLRNGTPIGGVTASTYTLVAADSGLPISFEVTPVAAAGILTGSAVTSSGLMISNSAPTANSVTITDDNGGSAEVGDTLTGNYTYSDVDGDIENTSTFRWLRDGMPISGATALNYTVVSVDSDQPITFEVTPVAAVGIRTGSAVTSSGLMISNSAPTANSVMITDDNGGSSEVGDTLTGNYVYSDVDGDIENTSTFRWLRNSTPIGSATALSYSLVAADSGRLISFEVTPVAVTGMLTGSAVTSSGLTIFNSAPTVNSVSITDANGGGTFVGDILTGNYVYNDVDGDAEGTSTFRWLRNSSPIGGATALTYALVTADSGQTIVFEITPVSATGTTMGSAVVSSGLTITNSAPTASSVNISGSAVVGATLTGSYTYNDVDGDAEGTSTFRWLRDGMPISGAIALNYTVVSVDSGQPITFEVTPVAVAGILTGSAVTSSGLTITNSAPTANSVSITDDNGGGTFVGDILTGNYVYNDVDGDIQGTSTFRWLRDGMPISGAIALNYIVVSVDSGQPITFEVTPVAAAGILTGSAVTSSSTTIANDIIAPTVSSTNPVNTATSVVLNTAITANFDEDIFSVTIDNSSFTLSNGSSISGAVTFDGVTNTATFTPDSNLDIFTSYTATLTTAITDLVGNPLASNYSWSFTTEGSVWGIAELIEFDNEGNALSPQVAANNFGNAIAVWIQVIAGQTSVLANRYAAGSWGTAELIDVSPGAASVPQVAIDGVGNAIAVWSQDDFITAGSPKSIWANRYTAGVGWGVAQQIESGSGTALSPQISFDGSGSAIVVWRQYNGAVNNIWANRYAFGSGWGSAVLITTDNTTDAFDPQVAVDSSGNAVVVWQQNFIETNIAANRYTFGLGWGTAVSIDSFPGPANSPQVEIDSIGNAIVVWRQYDGSIDSIVANRYTFGFGWGTAELIESGTNAALSPQVAMDSNGNAIAVWLQDGSVQVNRYGTFTGWGAADTIETNTGTPFTPQVAVDNSGNAIVIWTQNIAGQTSVLANRYTTGIGWGVAALIESNTGPAYDPQIVINFGNTMTVWSQDDGTRLNIYSNPLP